MASVTFVHHAYTYAWRMHVCVAHTIFCLYMYIAWSHPARLTLPPHHTGPPTQTFRYQRLRAGGIPDSNIISMQYNDVANDPQNPYPNSLYNKPSGKLYVMF